MVLVPVEHLPLPEIPIQLRPIESRLQLDVDVGWLGDPAVTGTLCFFSGSVSAFQKKRNAYLIDGVAISGVSGGPVLHSHPTDGVQIVGSITEYIARENQLGLSVAQDVSHFHEVAAKIRSIDEARKRCVEEAAQQEK